MAQYPKKCDLKGRWDKWKYTCVSSMAHHLHRLLEVTSPNLTEHNCNKQTNKQKSLLQRISEFVIPERISCSLEDGPESVYIWHAQEDVITSDRDRERYSFQSMMASVVESTPNERVLNVYWYSNVIHVQVKRVVVVQIILHKQNNTCQFWCVININCVMNLQHSYVQ